MPVPKVLADDLVLSSSAALWPDFDVARSVSVARITKTHAYGADLWRAQLTWQGQAEGRARRLQAFFAGLAGEEAFRLPPPGYRGPLGGISGTPAVVNSGVLGRTLQIDGVTGTNPIFQAGDLFGLILEGEHRVFMLDADVNESGGAATLTFAPAIATPTVANQEVYWQGLADPSGSRRLYLTMIPSDPAAAARRAWQSSLFSAFSAELVEYWPEA